MNKEICVEAVQLAEELLTHLREEEGLPQDWFTQDDRVVENAGVKSVDQKVLPSKSDTVDWIALKEQVMFCKKCRLCEGRNKVVFGSGKEDRPLIVFVGEGPGEEEDRTGEPFVGKAGSLLTAAITKGLKLNREDVFIGNVVKCRPPQNRNPLPDEIDACLPYLHSQLEYLAPRVIVTLGQPAQKALCGLDGGISRIRGNWQNWRGIPLMPTFHPAYILRAPSAKRFFWEDLKAVMKKIGLSI